MDTTNSFFSTPSYEASFGVSSITNDDESKSEIDKAGTGNTPLPPWSLLWELVLLLNSWNQDSPFSRDDITLLTAEHSPVSLVRFSWALEGSFARAPSLDQFVAADMMM